MQCVMHGWMLPLRMCEPKIYPVVALSQSHMALAYAGCDGIPPIERKTVGKMGLKGVPGLNLVASIGGGGGSQNQGRVRSNSCCSNKHIPVTPSAYASGMHCTISCKNALADVEQNTVSFCTSCMPRRQMLWQLWASEAEHAWYSYTPLL